MATFAQLRGEFYVWAFERAAHWETARKPRLLSWFHTLAIPIIILCIWGLFLTSGHTEPAPVDLSTPSIPQLSTFESLLQAVHLRSQPDLPVEPETHEPVPLDVLWTLSTYKPAADAVIEFYVGWLWWKMVDAVALLVVGFFYSLRWRMASVLYRQGSFDKRTSKRKGMYANDETLTILRQLFPDQNWPNKMKPTELNNQLRDILKVSGTNIRRPQLTGSSSTVAALPLLQQETSAPAKTSAAIEGVLPHHRPASVMPSSSTLAFSSQQKHAANLAANTASTSQIMDPQSTNPPATTSYIHQNTRTSPARSETMQFPESDGLSNTLQYGDDESPVQRVIVDKGKARATDSQVQEQERSHRPWRKPVSATDPRSDSPWEEEQSQPEYEDSEQEEEEPTARRRPGRKPITCDKCRVDKRKCSKTQPCTYCQEWDVECTWNVHFSRNHLLKVYVDRKNGSVPEEEHQPIDDEASRHDSREFGSSPPHPESVESVSKRRLDGNSHYELDAPPIKKPRLQTYATSRRTIQNTPVVDSEATDPDLSPSLNQLPSSDASSIHDTVTVQPPPPARRHVTQWPSGSVTKSGSGIRKMVKSNGKDSLMKKAVLANATLRNTAKNAPGQSHQIPSPLDGADPYSRLPSSQLFSEYIPGLQSDPSEDSTQDRRRFKTRNSPPASRALLHQHSTEFMRAAEEDVRRRIEARLAEELKQPIENICRPSLVALQSDFDSWRPTAIMAWVMLRPFIPNLKPWGMLIRQTIFDTNGPEVFDGHCIENPAQARWLTRLRFFCAGHKHPCFVRLQTILMLKLGCGLLSEEEWTHWVSPGDFDASHLCHRSWCFRPTCMVVEPKQSNLARTRCCAYKECVCGLTPRCRIELFIEKKSVVQAATATRIEHANVYPLQCPYTHCRGSKFATLNKLLEHCVKRHPTFEGEALCPFEECKRKNAKSSQSLFHHARDSHRLYDIWEQAHLYTRLLPPSLRRDEDEHPV
ncbi:hypothetical protein BU16DRAFT_559049 [Lophium mytilinum]|uniref:Zn(2)-C6 fungal-type domain-containing protein n=1 Tax=Lophium mytilinum TaxID=390894 RepID=A0A6A6QYI9_9PEZI|nr:hypothetical protein BU16DRAFT_559049 [Lophium mytilinum]